MVRAFVWYTVVSIHCLPHDWATESCPEVQPALGGKAWLL